MGFGLVSFVTGGASGLGKATVEHLFRLGGKVVLADLPTSEGAKIAAQISEENVMFVPMDVSKEAEVSTAFDECINRFGKLDAIVNCAGTAVAYAIFNKGEEKPHMLDRFMKVLETNVVGTFNVCRFGVGKMSSKPFSESEERGVIINTSGISTTEGQQGQVAYAAACGAIDAMTLPLCRDCSRNSIRVVTISPGLFTTPMAGMFPEKVHKFLQRLVPFSSRFGDPNEFAQLVQAVIQNQYINGCVIRLDGGLRLPP
ncbi:unnamed protein product [Soboliphyme baturini]|uniref:3-hydroxyacyl-CoA dehydrogenase type-2 n=1 Tax=Soboliphyme baturini TaxID=241478 RepID=A0A183II10_9BILA|nr:unnamed protein product [Soboliphyme baturini]